MHRFYRRFCFKSHSYVSLELFFRQNRSVTRAPRITEPIRVILTSVTWTNPSRPSQVSDHTFIPAHTVRICDYTLYCTRAVEVTGLHDGPVRRSCRCSSVTHQIMQVQRRKTLSETADLGCLQFPHLNPVRDSGSAKRKDVGRFKKTRRCSSCRDRIPVLGCSWSWSQMLFRLTTAVKSDYLSSTGLPVTSNRSVH